MLTAVIENELHMRLIVISHINLLESDCTPELTPPLLHSHSTNINATISHGTVQLFFLFWVVQNHHCTY